MPDDFDDYWKRALKEMKSVDANLEMKPTNLNLKNQESFEIWFTGVGNARIYCRYMRPAGAKNAPVIFKPNDYNKPVKIFLLIFPKIQVIILV